MNKNANKNAILIHTAPPVKVLTHEHTGGVKMCLLLESKHEARIRATGPVYGSYTDRIRGPYVLQCILCIVMYSDVSCDVSSEGLSLARDTWSMIYILMYPDVFFVSRRGWLEIRQDTSGYIRIHQNTVRIRSDRKPPHF